MVEKEIAHLIRSRAGHAEQALDAEDGQAMVEFALILPVLIALVMGILWFGRAINSATDETHLANEAARYAAVNSDPGAGSGQTLNQWILSQIDTSELKSGSSDVPSPAALSICFPNGTSNVGDPVQVTITSQFHFIKILNLSTLPITIKRSAVMRIEVPPTNYSATGSC